MKPKPTIHLLLLIAVLLSCNNKKKEQGLIESAQRLERQNEIAQVLNRMSEERILDDYSSPRFEYFHSPMKYYVEKARHFDDMIAKAIRLTNVDNSQVLFNDYLVLQQGYKLLIQKIKDSFSYWKIDTTIDAFMSMDEKIFISKYAGDGDSLNTKLRLAFLQADAIWIEGLLLDKIELSLNPSGSTFGNDMIAIGDADKIIYKKGERMKFNALLVGFTNKEIEYAIIDGKKVELTHGKYQYSRKITEKRGLHVFRFTVYITKNGNLEAYPVAVKYQVE